MADITELERRISSALDRIGTGLSGLSTAAPATADEGQLQTLQDALAAEKTANTQLEERVRAVKEKKDAIASGLQTELEVLRSEVAARIDENEQLKMVNGRLRRNNRALRDANEKGLGDPELINGSMVVELDALRTRREQDRAELDSILAELKPLVEGKADARG
jgi:chromosome segregation ATPase